MTDPRPFFGFKQPSTGLPSVIAYRPMPTRNSKSKRPPSVSRAVLARNVAELRDKKFAYLSTVTDRNRALAEEIDSSLSQIQRIVAGKVGPSTDTVELLANAFYVEIGQLLFPYFSNNISEDFYASKRAKDKSRKPPTGPRPTP